MRGRPPGAGATEGEAIVAVEDPATHHRQLVRIGVGPTAWVVTLELVAADCCGGRVDPFPPRPVCYNPPVAQVKGSQMLGIIKAVRSLRGEVEHRVPAHLRHYFEDRLIVAGWYPEADFAELTLLLGRVLTPRMPGNVWRMIGQSGADRDLQGVYAALDSRGHTMRAVARIPVGWTALRDHARVEVDSLSDGEAQLSLCDYAPMCRELAEVNAGYLEGVLQNSGAADYNVRVPQVSVERTSMRMTWTSRGETLRDL